MAELVRCQVVAHLPRMPDLALANLVRHHECTGKLAETEEGVAMWRVIVRVSYFHDSQSRLRNHVAALFGTMGLQNTNTGTWESTAVPLAQAAVQLAQVLHALANPQAIGGVDAQAALNHLWV